MKISPSLLAADFANLQASVAKIENTVEMLHLDVMDGNFVPNLSFGPNVIEALRPYSKLFFDVHLMIERPERYLEAFRKAGADGITIHYESTENPAEVLKTIKEMGASPAIAISPDTKPEVLFPLLPLCDMVLVMTVYPGFGGQKLIPACLEKATVLKNEIERQGLSVSVQADGGIGAANLADVLKAGINVVVAGSAVFGAEKPEEAVAAMRAVENSL
ncbi:MAG: ribulose-phosphate 3-epimerase [Ruminococcaceae bacterium]|nr:ribulose-phosphate 3-epimerase [Oscillospiraceae bacterium]